MRFLCLIVALLGISVAAIADDNADVQVYTDYPAGPWNDWSWATRTMKDTTYVHSYQYACKVSFTAWTAIRFRHEFGGQNSAGFTALEFWVNGGANSGQQFGINVAVNYVDKPIVNSQTYVTLSANTWKKVSIPLSALGAVNSNITDIYFRENHGASLPNLWIDDVKLVKTLPTGIQTITISPSTALATLNERHFGINTACWDGQLESAQTRARMTDAGFKVMRFPGGSTADEYDWALNKNKRTGISYNYAANTSDFLTVANNVGAQKMITVNYGSGTPTEAANWLTFTNVTNNANVVYWGIGNENYGSWEYDTHAQKQHAPTYATFVRDCWNLMKPIDPNIKIGVSGTSSESDYSQPVSVTNPRTGQSVSGWSPVLLKNLRDLGVTPDYYEVHYYPIVSGRENDAALLQSADDWTGIFAVTRQMLIDYLGAPGANVPIYFAENNSGGSGKMMTNLVDGMYYADSWAQAILAGGDAFLWWDLHNGVDTGGNYSATLYGTRMWGDLGLLSAGPNGGVGDPVNTGYPAYYAAKQVRRLAAPGDRMVSCTSSHPLLKCYAVLAGISRLRLMVVNEAAGLDLTAAINLGAVKPISSGTMWRYGTAEDAAKSDATLSSIPVPGTTMQMTFPRYSITVIEIPLRIPLIPSPLGNSGKQIVP